MRQYLQPAIFGGVATLLLALLLTSGWQWREAGKWRRATEQARQDLAAAVSANQATNDALGSCKQSNAEIMAGLRADLDAAAKAADGARAEAERLRRSVDADRRSRSEIYASDPESAAWGSTLVPERIADRLRL